MRTKLIRFTEIFGTFYREFRGEKKSHDSLRCGNVISLSQGNVNTAFYVNDRKFVSGAYARTVRAAAMVTRFVDLVRCDAPPSTTVPRRSLVPWYRGHDSGDIVTVSDALGFFHRTLYTRYTGYENIFVINGFCTPCCRPYRNHGNRTAGIITTFIVITR